MNEKYDIIAELMSKNKNSNSNTQKYKFLSCQNVIDTNKDTTNWIKLNEIIKKNNDLIIFDAILFKTKNIILKIGKSETSSFFKRKKMILLWKKNFVFLLMKQ
jgi:hypothetical protein